MTRLARCRGLPRRRGPRAPSWRPRPDRLLVLDLAARKPRLTTGSSEHRASAKGPSSGSRSTCSRFYDGTFHHNLVGAIARAVREERPAAYVALTARPSRPFNLYFPVPLRTAARRRRRALSRQGLAFLTPDVSRFAGALVHRRASIADGVGSPLRRAGVASRSPYMRSRLSIRSRHVNRRSPSAQRLNRPIPFLSWYWGSVSFGLRPLRLAQSVWVANVSCSLRRRPRLHLMTRRSLA